MERSFIYFKVKYNHFRELSGSCANAVLDREVMEDVECVLSLPKNYSETGEETPLILCFHGANTTVYEAENISGGILYIESCLDAGYAILDVAGSASHGFTYGCPEHLFAAYKAYRYAIRNYNLSERILVAGASMGGVTAINFINMFPTLPLAVGLIYPALALDGVDLGDHHVRGSWEQNTSRYASGKTTHDYVSEAYHFPHGEWIENNTIGFNPYRTCSFINADGQRVVIPPCPIKIWQGLADTKVDPIMTREFVASIRRSGSYVELHEIEGAGHSMSDMREVLDYEVPYWFNRFI
ncbi:MAG: hypothetical protein IJ315_00740 [Firmicutes bacterium]|nr:hypothetical protein [Bacillota bacterium]